MRMFILLVFLLFLSVDAKAATWYIIDSNNNVVAKQNGEPNAINLEKDGFYSVKSDLDIDLSKAKLRNNKIVESKKSQDEIDADNKNNTNRKSAIDKLKLLGLTDDEIKIILRR